MPFLAPNLIRNMQPAEQRVQKMRSRLRKAWRAITRKPPAIDNIRRSISRASPRESNSLGAHRLPPEIWLLILREATIPTYDPLDTSQELSFLDSPALRQADYRTCMHIKRDISLVSRSWHAMSLSLLYEFVWVSRAAQAKALAHTLLLQEVTTGDTCGRFIRRLHIQTSVLERCPPADLRTIVSYAPQLIIFTDHQSIQRNRYEEPDPKCSPEKICSLLAHPNNKLRRLSWTTYDDTPFHLDMSPLLSHPTVHLEYLELSSCSPNFSAILPQAVRSVSIPNLRSLKVSLDNVTFAVLAKWEMPLLTNLSVVSADYSYAGPGFAAFFEQHGHKIRQLELGHSSALVEEYVLARPHHATSHHPIRLADWCPNLREFICSADAEWHWQTPDWIAPHVLLPTHPTLEFIGIRDFDTRLKNDAALPWATSTSDDAPFFPLLEQMGSLLWKEAFPRLRYVRDLSEESHRMRVHHPENRVVSFWAKVIKRCSVRGVWLEDYMGVNITLRTLKRASLNL
ncbi:hypothetical protein NEOLEDRAFT_1178266 [Neolentinus lepideus HHB14362 ss-1]|uniref:F-box domain-containing protein n=1 Tax=Neolentinus lepideus HHB14362 ss-1 TaxID=1314782 RepID=A0A165SPI3_9AGAM|nr:hypothetical protein NEOLEDRAFT_1178266 [Neolentinus lepideus HHB14362 ss-1]